MKKDDFLDKFPDVKKYVLVHHKVLNHIEIKDFVEQMMSLMNTGLIFYQSQGRKITCFTSDKMKDALDKMVKGAKVVDPYTGEEGTITSEKPFLICGEYSINVDFKSESGAYSCEYFIV